MSVTLWLALNANARAAEALVTEAVVNAPIETVWALFTTAAGYQELGAAKADVDLRVGGLVRTQANESGTLDDANSRAREILAFDPLHMLASRPARVPADFPNREAVLKTWTVIYFNSIAGATTHVRVVTLGYDDTAAAQVARAATELRHRATLDQIVKRYRPQCAHCARPTDDAK
ncbi:MAG: SRPBCC domain-containing protein [Steroidobacteraceae bacterium]